MYERTVEQARGLGSRPRRDHGGAVRPARSGCRRARGDACWRANGTSVVGAQLGTPVPGAQTWHVLVNNVSPEGENWSFNTFYPDNLQAHPGDTIVFTLAPNPQAFHTVHILTLGMTPLEWYSGFSGGFVQSDLTRPGGWQSPYFGIEAATPCGRAGQDPCLFNADDIGHPDWNLASTPASSSTRRRAAARATRRSRSRWIPGFCPAPTTSRAMRTDRR